MTSAAVSHAVPPEAIRVFLGFPRPELSQAQFFSELGSTFMPGTPYMLQPLGLAAYLPGVSFNPAPGLPHEFALICYPSVEVWQAAMHDTLRGRVYNQTHGGVYATPPSGAAFPVHLDNLPPTAADPFYLFSGALDWQTGATRVAVAAKRDPQQSGLAFRAALRNALAAARQGMAATGIDQAIVSARDESVVLWFHCAADEVTVDLGFLASIVAPSSVLENRRVICRDEPPVLAITGAAAYNFIFLREPKYFLR